MNRFKRLLLVISVLLLAGGITSASSGSASAAAAARPNFGCAIETCNNTDPSATGCWDGNAYVASSNRIIDNYGDVLGFVLNWYSRDCGTNWSEVYTGDAYPGGGDCNLTVYVYNGSISSSRYTTYYNHAWSNQIYSPYTVAHAYGKIYCSSASNGAAIASA
jgi:hypothetical protein